LYKISSRLELVVSPDETKHRSFPRSSATSDSFTVSRPPQTRHALLLSSVTLLMPLPFISVWHGRSRACPTDATADLCLETPNRLRLYAVAEAGRRSPRRPPLTFEPYRPYCHRTRKQKPWLCTTSPLTSAIQSPDAST
jgi:hypothetical protein